MEPQIINYYNHKNVLCKICSQKGHTSEYCPNVGMAKIGTKEKKKKKVDGFVITLPLSPSPKKKRGRKPKKKEEKTYEITNEQEAIGNSSNRDAYLPENGWSDTAWNM